MIYNYAILTPNNRPTVISSVEANTFFPGFQFEDCYTYYIYPKDIDQIIYNYSLGVFYQFIGSGQYKQITITPLITAEQMGTYIGYTQSNPDQLPTLYYENGRLTLEHKNCRNIGWHPRKTGSKYTNYVYGNLIAPNAAPKKFERKSQFNQQEFDQDVAAAAQSTSNDVRLLELYYDENFTIQSRHPSRSRLVLGPVPNFVLQEVNKFLAVKEINPPPF